MPLIPITIVTGFVGSGKTTLLLNLIPQLPKNYKLALLKNEFGDVAIDSQLASASAISGVHELLNGCICCNLVGQLGDALSTLRENVEPDRIVIEASGSAFPATLAMEVNRLGRESGHYVVDGVIVVIDVENWQGYEDTSYTAKMQAKYTDLIVFNKWELVSERRYEDCLDRVGDLDLQVAHIKSNKGRVEIGVLLGLDSALAKHIDTEGHEPTAEDHDHRHDHQSEVEVLSVSLMAVADHEAGVDLEALEMLLLSAPKDEVYRMKAIIVASSAPTSSDGSQADFPDPSTGGVNVFILNWAFGRWTFTLTKTSLDSLALESHPADSEVQKTDDVELAARMTIVCARDESKKWKKRIEAGEHLKLEDAGLTGKLEVRRLL